MLTVTLYLYTCLSENIPKSFSLTAKYRPCYMKHPWDHASVARAITLMISPHPHAAEKMEMKSAGIAPKNV